MYFVIYGNDKPGQPQVRQNARPAHVDYLATFGKRILIAGPLLGDDGQPDGSLIVVDIEDKAAAAAFSAGDPYTRAGLFASVAITAWRKSIPKD
ncbi:MAG: YciI family protein [Rhodospirillales bacterium]|nr:YciI family protein [Rhodospirillales bacterium]